MLNRLLDIVKITICGINGNRQFTIIEDFARAY